MNMKAHRAMFRGAVFVLALALSVIQPMQGAQPPAHSVDPCDPRIRQALIDVATKAANRQYALIINSRYGISDPKSVFDLDCLNDLFDLPQLNVLIDPDHIYNFLKDLLKRKVCDAWNKHVAATTYHVFDADLFDNALPLIPGVYSSGDNVPVRSGRAGPHVRIPSSQTLGTPGVKTNGGGADLLRTLLGQ